MAADQITPAEVVDFWREAGADRWWAKDDAFDAAIRTRFLALWHEAECGGLTDWRATDTGLLALIILCDQFPRNMFRGDRSTYATDPLALELARRAVETRLDARVDPALRQFVYMPFMHSEALADQERCVALFQAAGETDNMKYAEDHADIVRRFGRFPHRNVLLGRDTTAAEQAFLDAGGFSG